MKKAINIRIDEELLKELDSAAAELERSRTWVIEKAVGLYMDSLDEMIADKRIDDLKSGKTAAVSMEEVFKRAGLTT
ncbi:MAG: ribbon-helix-helix protein, CopG family [Campylobacterales bacterium]